MAMLNIAWTSYRLGGSESIPARMFLPSKTKDGIKCSFILVSQHVLLILLLNVFPYFLSQSDR